jgi:hypothetical protein
VFGPNHSETLTCLLHFGNCLDDFGKDEEANEVWQLIQDWDKENEEDSKWSTRTVHLAYRPWREVTAM